MIKRKGIILAGGSGTRLYPLTMAVSKQLLPIYDKPMVYYPLSVLMLAGIQEVAVITTPEDQEQFKRLLDDGSQWNVQLTYITQPSPDGLAQAFILAEDFLDGAPSAMVLGDNIFYGHGLREVLAEADADPKGASVFGYHVADPERYGVVDFDADGTVRSIIEKPETPASNYAVTGLYFVDETAPARAKLVKPSNRGELEITSLLESYLGENNLTLKKMGRGFAWLDTGTHDSLLDAAGFIATLQKRQGLMVACPEEIAYRKGWISAEAVLKVASQLSKNSYGQYLSKIVKGLNTSAQPISLSAKKSS